MLRATHQEPGIPARLARAVWRRLAGAFARLAQVLGEGGDRRARLRTLILIRWMAIVGQAFTVCLVYFSLEFPLPLLPLLAAIALSALINIVLSLSFGATTRLTERGAALLLGYDIVQLSFLLGLTGGLQNPFAILLLVPVTLSATILSLRTTVALCVLVIGAVSVLGLFPTELPWSEAGLRLPRLYMLATWSALVLGTALIAGYAWRVADEARRMSQGLAATQMALAREQQLSALGGLAAAAAHELGSPLATIAVTARELANSIPPDSPLTEDVAELVSQSQRCREILKSLSQQGAGDELAPFTRVPLSHLLETVAEPFRRLDVALDVVVEGDLELEPTLTPTPELRHALANLIDNAVGYAEQRVLIIVALSSDLVAVRIEDDGPGFSPEVIELLGEPYVSSRPAAGLGLGVFIAQTLLARTGATLHFANPGRGARVTIGWRRAVLEQHRPEA
ncbi:MAG TPA: ActS/PrrB/RegB family redox-sensitive histidine kinase [Geminicoccaceae bacterium]|nr:ActS/PrrB/RegB family redox-sensitive histidine kinase [Geminicoccaceae bacterium]